MPLCEVRFGTPLDRLLNVRVGEELKIVGLSGNVLLRAHLRHLAGQAASHLAQATLEILMPEAASAARAAVRPSASDPEAFDIVGYRGLAYGTLHTRSNCPCYVTHGGQIVLTIDGSPHSLQFAVRADDSQSLASVRCASESFKDGEQHLEIRVEPGVDSVLVLACVLAVLLLSPYHRVAGIFK